MSDASSNNNHHNMNNNNEDGLRKLNKELLIRNAELVKRLNRMKTERDNFEQLFIDWKKINKDASEALNLLQKDKTKLQQENLNLNQQIKDSHLQIQSLKLQNNERMEQCNHLLLRCNQYQNDLNQLKQQQQPNNNNNNNNNNINTLKFNYQQKKNEIEQILYEIQKLFKFCHTNYPQITSINNSVINNNNNNIQQYKYHDGDNDDDEEEVDIDDGFDDDFSKMSYPQKPKYNSMKKKTRDFTHRSTKSLSDFDKNIFRKRRSLNYIYDNKEITKIKKIQKKNQQKLSKKNKDNKNVNIVISGNNHRNGNNHHHHHHHQQQRGIDSKITPELLGPKTSYHQYDNKRSDPFGRTLSSHSFFSEQRYRYNQVQLNMTSNKLWGKRDSLTRKRKQPRINAIPSSAGSTPLTTPNQSLRGKLSDDEDNTIYFDEDPHQKYLEMMGGSQQQQQQQKQPPPPKQQQPPQQQQQQQQQPPSSSSSQSTRNKLTDKKTIHDLFDMLQQQTLSSSSPVTATTTTSSASNTNEDTDGVGADFYDEQQNNSDAQLVPLPEPSDSSSDSDTNSDSDSSSD